jgi:hypothetical protein
MVALGLAFSLLGYSGIYSVEKSDEAKRISIYFYAGSLVCLSLVFVVAAMGD